MITGATRVAAVLGWPVAHSKSPQLLNAAFAATGIDAVLVPIGVPPERLAGAVATLRAMRALGASVTLPHKLDVAALCDELSPAARAIGAVNCLELGERVIGHNTDAPGFRDALAGAGFDPRGKHCVVLGAGGAARAIVHALGEVEQLARRLGNWTGASLRAAFARADLVVDCTSASLEADTGTAFADELPLDALPPPALVATLVYHRRTELLQRASARGHSTLDGAAMLVHQAAHAFEIWTGMQAPLSEMMGAF